MPAVSGRPRWGQNFLVDRGVAREIVEWAEVDGREVVEVGAGRGILTELIAERCARLVAIEIDRRLAGALRQRFADQPHVSVLAADALALDYRELVGEGAVAVGNLPYESGTAIVRRLLETGVRFRHVVVMLQREVCARIAAKPGTRAWGALAVHVQMVADVELGRRVGPGCFRPRPQVESQLVRLRPLRTMRHEVGERAIFEELVRAAFSSRRKMVRNSLGRWLEARLGGERALRLLEEAGVDERARPAELGLVELAALARAASRELSGNA